MARAAARHILVKTEQQARDLKTQIDAGQAKFEDLAKKHSTCPSGKSGGALKGLTFGIAEGVREALEDVVRSAEEHALFGEVQRPRRATLSFRPSPQD